MGLSFDDCSRRSTRVTNGSDSPTKGGVFVRWFAAAFLLVYGSSSHALPVTFNYQETYADFIAAGETTPLQNNGPNCASTALMNSFVYLENSFPSAFAGSSLTTGSNPANNVGQARDELCGIIGGATNKAIWQGKLKWFSMFAPGAPVMFEGMAVDDISTWANKQLLTQGAPTLDFLAEQIMKGQDVEIGITGGAEHELTLTGISRDANGNLFIDYIDPNCVSGKQGQANVGPSHVQLTQQNDGLHFGWQNGNGTTCNGNAVDVTIDSAWAESVPEPGTLFLVGVGWIGLLRVTRRVYVA